MPQEFEGIAVITGFIAADEDGLQTTLGRNGSDYSAAIFAALGKASELSIWTDVDGVMSADPNRVPEARVIERLTYNEAMELAYFGAKVIHPQTLGPAVQITTFRSSFVTASILSTQVAGSPLHQRRKTTSRGSLRSVAWLSSISRARA